MEVAQYSAASGWEPNKRGQHGAAAQWKTNMKPRREDRRPASIHDPGAVKKCGHCQEMKPCVEFSADVSRGDGLRGWCKVCEAEARSNRYKKRKAVAMETSAARRRLEQPLGGLPQFVQSGSQSEQELPMHIQQQHDLQRQQLEAHQAQQHAPNHHQQLLAAHLQAHMQEAHQQQQAQQWQQQQQQQQQPAIDVAFLQRQMAVWQAQRNAAAVAEAQAMAKAAAAAGRTSAFQAVPRSSTSAQQPSATAAVQLSLSSGGAVAQDAATQFLAAAAANDHGLQLGGRAVPSPHAAAAETGAKGAARHSPDTSDSDTDAAAALTGMKHAGRGLGRPARSTAAADPLWRTSAGSQDSAATASAPLPAVAPPPALPRISTASAPPPAASWQTLSPSRGYAQPPQDAPLPPLEQPHIPRKARTRATPPAASAVVLPQAVADRSPAARLVPFAPPSADLEDVKQWSAHVMAVMMVLRAGALQS